jgi:hypothetical protein
MFHWSPLEIGKSDIESLISIALRYPKWKAEVTGKTGNDNTQRVYADQAEF